MSLEASKERLELQRSHTEEVFFKVWLCTWPLVLKKLQRDYCTIITVISVVDITGVKSWNTGAFSSAQEMVSDKVRRFFLPVLKSLLEEKRNSWQAKETPNDAGICFISGGWGFLRSGVLVFFQHFNSWPHCLLLQTEQWPRASQGRRCHHLQCRPLTKNLPWPLIF